MHCFSRNEYGANCALDCQCNSQNTKSCHHVTGICTCNDGFTGSSCSSSKIIFRI